MTRDDVQIRELCLRLREGAQPDCAAVIEAFLPRARISAARDIEHRILSIRAPARKPGVGSRAAGKRVLPVFFARSEYPIPAIDSKTDDGITDAWKIRAGVEGYVALAPLDQHELRRPRARALTTIAACLPLALTPAAVMAAPEDPEPPLQTPSAAPPDGDATEPPAEAPAPETIEAPPAEVERPANAETPSVDIGIWQALVGTDLELTFEDGTTFAGRLLASHDDLLICARATDGLVVALDRGRVVQVNAVLASQPPPATAQKTGTGLLIAGISLTALAGALVVGGIAMHAQCAATAYYSAGYCAYYWIPFGIAAVATAGPGIPMLVIGKKRRKAWKQAQRTALIAPAVGLTRTAWTGGLRVRF